MITLNKNILASLICLVSYTTAFCMYDNDPIEDFVMVNTDPKYVETIEIDNGSKQKTVESNIKKAKEMITNAEKSLTKVKNTVESEEVTTFLRTLNAIKRSLRNMVFKSGPGFQIINKDKNPIWVTIVADGEIFSNLENGRDEIEPKGDFTMELANLDSPLTIDIYTDENEITPTYSFITTAGAQGKTKYFTWNPAKHKIASKSLYPQTGILGVSRKKYNLSNNIKAFQLLLKK